MFECEYQGTIESFQACILKGYGTTILLSQISIVISIASIVCSVFLGIILFLWNRGLARYQSRLNIGQALKRQLADIFSEIHAFWISDAPKDRSQFLKFEDYIDRELGLLYGSIMSASRTKKETDIVDSFSEKLADFELLSLGAGQSDDAIRGAPYSNRADFIFDLKGAYGKIIMQIDKWVALSHD